MVSILWHIGFSLFMMIVVVVLISFILPLVHRRVNLGLLNVVVLSCFALGMSLMIGSQYVGGAQMRPQIQRTTRQLKQVQMQAQGKLTQLQNRHLSAQQTQVIVHQYVDLHQKQTQLQAKLQRQQHRSNNIGMITLR